MNIGGEWVSGRVMISDGHGVAVLEPKDDMCVVRRDAITCVRLSPRPRPAPGPKRPARP